MTPEKLKDYCMNEIEINIKECIDLKVINNRYKCFKITLSLANRDKILDGKYWPENIWVRKFHKSRNNNARTS